MAMRWSAIPKGAFALVAAVALEGQAGQVIEGKWIQDGQFVQLHTACSQAWLCVPSQPTMYASELQLVGPPRKVTVGACNVGGGNVEECNYCSVNPPDTPCSLTLQPR
jgi:hypothetical protein